MVVGKENVGKTSLVRNMGLKWGSTTIETDNLSTDGIDVATFKFGLEGPKTLRLTKKKKFRVKSVKLHVWDFAGQDIYVLNLSSTYL